MTRPLLYALTVMGAALAIGGCGGDDGDETTAPVAPPPVETTALTKEELLAQGDAICAEVNAAVGALASTEAGGEAVESAELYSGMVERLQDLGAPSDDAAGYSEFSAAAEELAQAQGDVELAADRGDVEGLAAAEAEASTALASFQEAASDYGFEQCGEEPSAVPATGTGGAIPGAETEEEAAPEEVEEVEEEAPEEVEEVAPETGGAGSAEGGGAGGGAEAGGEVGGGEAGGDSGGIGPG
ncbi:MAG TPA: hypothetical protein VHF50_04335 [Solirubrobacterales bacterium]|nr:hypothetical protein [Solirubrobacterales bacterium]